MKKFTVLVIALLLCVPSIVQAGRKKADKSGKIKNNVFTDAKYNFQINLPDGWKAKTSKKDDVLRLTLKKEKNKKIIKKKSLNNPIMYVINNGNYTNIPIVNIWVVNTDKSAKDFLNALINDSHKSKFKDEFIEAIRPVWSDASFTRFETKKKNKFITYNHNGFSWFGSFVHSYLVAENRTDAPLGGAIYVIQNDESSIIFISIKTEVEVIDEVLEIIQPMLKSLQWNK